MGKYSNKLQQEKLDSLIEEEGIEDEIDFMENYGLSSIVPGICMNPNCDATYQYEPDQNEGYCDECETNSVVSGLILLGVM